MEKMFFAQNFLAKVKKYNYSYENSSGGGPGFLVGFFWFLLWVGMYVYGALTLMLIAKKTNTSGSWMAWVPILNLYLAVKSSGKSMIWLLLSLLPFVNIVAIVVIWAAISERLGKPGWWGILILVPIANLIMMGILAFSKGAENSDASDNFCSECGAKK